MRFGRCDIFAGLRRTVRALRLSSSPRYRSAHATLAPLFAAETRRDSGTDWCTKNSVPHGVMHLMRRTRATLIYRHSKNLRDLQRMLGHSKLESKVRYLGILVGDTWGMAR